MLSPFETDESGFSLSVSLALYARPAVIKALYPYHDKYLITYEVIDETLNIHFKPFPGIEIILDEEKAKILQDLDFQMIRFDTMQATKEVRQLLIGRALYATCIEPEPTGSPKEETLSEYSWKEDKKAIFSSWTTGK